MNLCSLSFIDYPTPFSRNREKIDNSHNLKVPCSTCNQYFGLWVFLDSPQSCAWSISGAFTNRNGPERIGTDRNGPP